MLLKFQGTKKEMEKKKFELFKKGYITFMEQYDKNIYCLVAKKV